MLDKQITNAYAAIEIAIGRDKLHAQFKINAQLPKPQRDLHIYETAIFMYHLNYLTVYYYYPFRGIL